MPQRINIFRHNSSGCMFRIMGRELRSRGARARAHMRAIHRRGGNELRNNKDFVSLMFQFVGELQRGVCDLIFVTLSGVM